MEEYTPIESKKEAIQHYRQLIQDFENQIETFDKKLSDPNEPGIKKQGWKMLREISEKELQNCRAELDKLLKGEE